MSYYSAMLSESTVCCKKCKQVSERYREVDVDPLKTFTKNKTNLDLRNYTRNFSLLKPFKKEKFEVGQVYYVYYPTNESLTDKWHQISVVYCLGRYHIDGVTFARNLNLLYLPIYNQLDVLEKAHYILEKSKSINYLVYQTLKMHEQIQNTQMSCAIKDFKESKVTYCRKVAREEWGMIPLLKKELFGNLSATGLMESFEAENRKPVVILREKKKVKEKEVEWSDEIDNEEDVDYEAAFDYDSDWKGITYVNNKLD